jgi:ZIP family zinc transporter
MSSAATMRQQGVSFNRIFWLWMSLTLVTGIASALGNTLFADASPALFAFFEGAAAGGMLAMTAQTMLPEAFEQGGGTTSGVLTVVGFLAAIFVRSLAGTPGH